MLGYSPAEPFHRIWELLGFVLVDRVIVLGTAPGVGYEELAASDHQSSPGPAEARRTCPRETKYLHSMEWSF